MPTAPFGSLLATSRYQASDAIAASGLRPFGITVTPPRFKLGYELAGRLPELAPPAWMLSQRGRPDLAAAYVEHLDRLSVQRISRLLADAIGESPGVVLCCYEDVWAGQQCHRRWFAVYWALRTGQHVPELPPALGAPRSRSHSLAQLSLFADCKPAVRDRR